MPIPKLVPEWIDTIQCRSAIQRLIEIAQERTVGHDIREDVIKVKLSCAFSEHHAMKGYCESGGIAPRIV